jgi:hypothetical protein
MAIVIGPVALIPPSAPTNSRKSIFIDSPLFLIPPPVSSSQVLSASNGMDDACERVFRYLFMQLVVNVSYGIPVAIGLYFISVPNARSRFTKSLC